MPRKQTKKDPKEMISFGRNGEQLTRKTLGMMEPMKLAQHDAVLESVDVYRDMSAAQQEYRGAVIELFGTLFDDPETAAKASYTVHTLDQAFRARFRFRESIGLNPESNKAMTIITDWLGEQASDTDSDLIALVSDVFGSGKMSVARAIRFCRYPLKDEKLKEAQRIVERSIVVDDGKLTIEVHERQEDGTWAKVA